MRFARRWAELLRDERGSAALEFVTLGVVLVVPLVYLVLAVAALQAGALAAEGAARQAARVWVRAGSETEADQLGAASIAVAASDFGFGGTQVSWQRACQGACWSAGSRVTISVQIQVPMPLVPPILGLPDRVSIPMRGTATQTVSKFGGG